MDSTVFASLMSATISAVIAGVFGLIGQRMEFGTVGGGGGGGATASVPLGSTSMSLRQRGPGQINYGLAVKQVGILQLVLNLVGLIVGFTMGASGADLGGIIIAILFIGTILLIAGFVWVSLKVEPATMWKHLTVVALAVAIITVILNAIILQVPLALASLFFALAQTFISMGIGGAIANKIRR